MVSPDCRLHKTAQDTMYLKLHHRTLYQEAWCQLTFPNLSPLYDNLWANKSALLCILFLLFRSTKGLTSANRDISPLEPRAIDNVILRPSRPGVSDNKRSVQEKSRFLFCQHFSSGPTLLYCYFIFSALLSNTLC